MAYAGRLRQKGIPFSGFRYTKGWISLVEVYKRVGKSVITSVCKKDFKKANRRICGGEKVKNISWFCDATF